MRLVETLERVVCDDPYRQHNGTEVKGVESRDFTRDRTHYVLDLCAADAKKFDAALTPFTAVGTKERVAARTRSRVRRQEGSDTAKIREWAKSHGLEVAERGRISEQVIDAYNAAGGN